MIKVYLKLYFDGWTKNLIKYFIDSFYQVVVAMLDFF